MRGWDDVFLDSHASWNQAFFEFIGDHHTGMDTQGDWNPVLFAGYGNLGAYFTLLCNGPVPWLKNDALALGVTLFLHGS